MVAQFGTTSFIPKKPETSVVRRSKGGVINVFFLVALIVFLTSVVASVGVFFYKQVAEQRLEEKVALLEKTRTAFEPALVTELATVDSHIKSAQNILNSHIALSAFFNMLEQSTLQSVQFDSFTFSHSDESGMIVQMKGRGLSFSSVALQSDIFGKNPYIQGPIFSNLDLDNTGSVLFDFSAVVDPTLVSYQRLQRGTVSSQ